VDRVSTVGQSPQVVEPRGRCGLEARALAGRPRDVHRSYTGRTLPLSISRISGEVRISCKIAPSRISRCLSPVRRGCAWPDVPAGKGGTKMKRRMLDLRNVRPAWFSTQQGFTGLGDPPWPRMFTQSQHAIPHCRTLPIHFPPDRARSSFPSAVHCCRYGEILAGMLCLADSPVKLAQAKVAVGD
jgi:hypothetical protein